MVTAQQMGIRNGDVLAGIDGRRCGVLQARSTDRHLDKGYFIAVAVDGSGWSGQPMQVPYRSNVWVEKVMNDQQGYCGYRQRAGVA